MLCSRLIRTRLAVSGTERGSSSFRFRQKIPEVMEGNARFAGRSGEARRRGPRRTLRPFRKPGRILVVYRAEKNSPITSPQTAIVMGAFPWSWIRSRYSSQTPAMRVVCSTSWAAAGMEVCLSPQQYPQMQLCMAEQGTVYDKMVSRGMQRSSPRIVAAMNAVFFCMATMQIQARKKERERPVRRNSRASRSFPKETLRATVREMAVSIPAVVREQQSAQTGKMSWYSPTPSSPKVRLKKMR